MNKDKILYIKINEEGQIHIKPEFLMFPMIYRTASEVHWNNDSKTLYSSKTRDGSYLDWYNHIIEVAQGNDYCQLEITPETEWINTPNNLRKEIEKIGSR